MFLNSCLDRWWRHKLYDLSSITLSWEFSNDWLVQNQGKRKAQKFEYRKKKAFSVKQKAFFAVFRNFHILENVGKIHRGGLLLIKMKASAILLKVTLLYGCFSCFLNCTNDTKSRKVSHCIKIENTSFNPFHANVLLLYPLKTSENLFSDIFRWYRNLTFLKDPVLNNELAISIEQESGKNLNMKYSRGKIWNFIRLVFISIYLHIRQLSPP